ncbi:MAG: LysR family transcriptional regulator [Ardenticatenaceae bacterium]|nr:LysR family transcriptional regulator [Ardenticatenaceae bacterium]
MNLSQLEVLVAIVDTGSLTEAAEHVGLTQSAVSYSLSRLEAELGVTLLERGRRGGVVTRIGAEVLQHARNTLNQIEAIRQKAAHERGLTRGKLRFGCVPTIPVRLLTGVIRDFQQKFPDIETVIFEGSPREILNWLENGTIDIGIVVNPDDYLLSAPFVRGEVVAIMSDQHHLAASKDVSLDDLLEESFIALNAEYREYGGLAELVNNAAVKLPQPHHEVSTPATIFAMVQENLGVSLVFKMLLDSQAEGITALPLNPKQDLDIYLASNMDTPSVTAFLENASVWAKAHGFATSHP